MHFKMEPLLESECEVRNCSTIRKQSSQTSVQHATTIYTKSPGWLCVLRHKIYHIPGTAAQRLSARTPRHAFHRAGYPCIPPNGSIDPTARNPSREHGTKSHARPAKERKHTARLYSHARRTHALRTHRRRRTAYTRPAAPSQNCSHVLALNILQGKKQHKQNESHSS